MINSCILSGLTESGKYHCSYVFCISGRKKKAKSMKTGIIITKKLYLYRDFLHLSEYIFQFTLLRTFIGKSKYSLLYIFNILFSTGFLEKYISLFFICPYNSLIKCNLQKFPTYVFHYIFYCSMLEH